MNPEDVNSWSTYLDFVKYLESNYDQDKTNHFTHVSKILYRGQADSTWKLNTTLEREVGEDFSFDNYNRKIISARRKIMGIFQNNLPFIEDPYLQWNDLLSSIPNYEWMAYLRHHGFPSPLLDWSASPYVAAFFAFRNCDHRSVDKKISIYCYQEYVGEGKSWSSNEPKIISLGPWATVHKRHVTQQSQYTACAMEDKDGRVIFKSHDRVMNPFSDAPQDRLIKLEIPTSERGKAMDSLALMNITAYWLFQTEDAMAESLGEELIGV